MSLTDLSTVLCTMRKLCVDNRKDLRGMYSEYQDKKDVWISHVHDKYNVTEKTEIIEELLDESMIEVLDFCEKLLKIQKEIPEFETAFVSGSLKKNEKFPTLALAWFGDTYGESKLAGLKKLSADLEAESVSYKSTNIIKRLVDKTKK
jgi:hypothetical protein